MNSQRLYTSLYASLFLAFSLTCQCLEQAENEQQVGQGYWTGVAKSLHLQSSAAEQTLLPSATCRCRSHHRMGHPRYEQSDLERVIKYTYNTENEEWVREKIMVKFLESSPFAKGGMRVCFRVQEITEDPRTGDYVARGVQVAKMFMSKLPTEIHFDEAMSQTLAQDFALEFNTLTDQLGLKAKLRFLPVSVMKLLERGGQLVNVEPFMEGNYVKHNDNDGHVCTTDPLPQAFSHFTWEVSEGSLLICDIQGVGHYYTDPQIHSIDGKGFGGGNMGLPGIRRFFRSHKCNGMCRKLGLTPVEVAEDGPVSPRRGHSSYSPPVSVMQRRSQRIKKWDQQGLYLKGMQNAHHAMLDNDHHGRVRTGAPKLCSDFDDEAEIAGSPGRNSPAFVGSPRVAMPGSPGRGPALGKQSPAPRGVLEHKSGPSPLQRQLHMSHRGVEGQDHTYPVMDALRQLSMGNNESHLPRGQVGHRGPAAMENVARAQSPNPAQSGGLLMHLMHRQDSNRGSHRSPSPQAHGMSSSDAHAFDRAGSRGMPGRVHSGGSLAEMVYERRSGGEQQMSRDHSGGSLAEMVYNRRSGTEYQSPRENERRYRSHDEFQQAVEHHHHHQNRHHQDVRVQ